MSKIIELPEVLANQIAAGEVVERPASVVKELVENAIDAAATRVTVRIEESGLRLIEIVDNGIGIEADDVSRALLRHATSKIKDSSDLFRIRTLGFRGEALPSIAAVSELTLETCAADEPAGSRLFVRAGKIENSETIQKREGTKITVQNLFYNTPARLKYIRSLQAELAHITDVLNRQSLAHPEISFSLVNDGNELLHSTGSGDLRQAIAKVYGMQSARKMIAIQSEDLDFKVAGYVSLPELTRASKSYLTLIINGRYIKNFLLHKAIIDGYGSKLMIGRFPIAVISISADPQLLDVNVHPTKQEIRLSKEKELRELIISAIRRALSDEVLIPDALENLASHPQNKGNHFQQPAQLNPENYDEIFDPKKFVQTELSVSDGSPDYQANAPEEASELPEEAPKPSQKFPDLQFLAQFHRTYLLCEAADGLYIVDQHAAQERVKYEYYRDKIGEVSFDQQQLLTPVVIHLPKDDFLKVSENIKQLQEAGIFLSEYGDNQFILREHPIWMQEGEIESAVYEFIDLLLADEQTTVAKYREKLAILISCKASIKANMPIDPESARELLRQLADCENPYNCPHGRPSIVHYSNTDMQKMFRRIMQSHHSARNNQDF